MAKRIAMAVVLIFALAISAPAAEWKLDKSHSAVQFKVSHMVISKVAGKFTEFSATLQMDTAKFADSDVEMIVDAASIFTNDEERDKHLRSADFFAVEEYPELRFEATKVSPGDGNEFQLIGDLTMHGVTKEVTFDCVMNGIIQDPWGNTRAGFSASTMVDRKEFGIDWSKTLDAGGLVVGDDVEISLDLEFVKVT